MGPQGFRHISVLSFALPAGEKRRFIDGVGLGGVVRWEGCGGNVGMTGRVQAEDKERDLVGDEQDVVCVGAWRWAHPGEIEISGRGMRMEEGGIGCIRMKKGAVPDLLVTMPSGR